MLHLVAGEQGGRELKPALQPLPRPLTGPRPVCRSGQSGGLLTTLVSPSLRRKPRHSGARGFAQSHAAWSHAAGTSQVGRPPEPELQPAGPPALQCTSTAHGLGEAAGNRVSAYGAEGAPGSQAGSGGSSGSKGRVTRPPCRIHLSSPWESLGCVIFQTTGEAAGVRVLHSAFALGTNSFLSESRSLLKEDMCRFPPSMGGAGGCRRGTVWRGARSPVS